MVIRRLGSKSLNRGNTALRTAAACVIGGVDARNAALHALVRVKKGETAQAALDAVLRQNALEKRDAALCTELLYGCLRTQIRLDSVLHTLLCSPHKLPAEMYQALGLGVYALLFLHRIPAHATIDWTVAYVRRRFGRVMGNVANGTLRSLQRLGVEPLNKSFYTSLAATSLEREALFYGMPLWIARLWATAYGEESATLCMARSAAQPWPCVRINALYPAAEELRVAVRQAGGKEITPWGFAFPPQALTQQLCRIELFQGHDTGVFSWQAAGSQWVLQHVPEKAGPWWDACAGQGGKTFALIERGAEVGLCSDVNMPRLRQLQHTAIRLGLPCPPVAVSDMRVPPIHSWEGGILLDVPCSGLGTLARRPEIRQRRQKADIESLVILQRQLIMQAWELLKPGRHLVYMTCTLNPAENDEQTRFLLERYRDAACCGEWQTPHHHPWMEGMYVAVLKKNRGN